MALSSFTVTIITKSDSPFNVIPNAPIEIRERLANGASGNLSLIFSDQAGLNPITQVGFTTNSLGQATFFAAAADYNAVYDNNGTPVTIAVDVGVTGEILKQKGYVSFSDLLQTVINSNDATVIRNGGKIKIGDRDDSLFNIVTLGSLGGGTLNGFDEINLLGFPTLALKIRFRKIINITQLGAITNADIADVLDASISLVNKGDQIQIHGKYKIARQVNVNKAGLQFAGLNIGVPIFENNDLEEFTSNYLICDFDDSTKSMFFVEADKRGVNFNGLCFYGQEFSTKAIEYNDSATDGSLEFITLSRFKKNGIKLALAGHIKSCVLNGSLTNDLTGNALEIGSDVFVSNVVCQFWGTGLKCSGSHLNVTNSYFDLNKTGVDASITTYSKFSNVKAGYNSDVGFLIGGPGSSARTTNFSNCIAQFNGGSDFDQGLGRWLDDGVGWLINDCRQISLTGCTGAVDVGGDGQNVGMKIVGSVDNLAITGGQYLFNDTKDIDFSGHTAGRVYINNINVGKQDNLDRLISTVINAGVIEQGTLIDYPRVEAVVAGDRLSPTNFNRYMLTSVAAITLGAFFDGFIAGGTMIITNIGTFDITIPFVAGQNETNSGVDIVLTPKQGVTFMWTGNEWIQSN